MAPFFSFLKCLAAMTATLPVVVTKMSPIAAASSMDMTMNPSMWASRARRGSISVTIIFAPSPWAFFASPRPQKPYPATTKYFPAMRVFVVIMIDVEGTLPGSMDIVKEPFHRGVVYGDNREFEFSFISHRPETVDTGRGLFAATDDLPDEIPAFGVDVMDEVHPVINRDDRLRIEHLVNRSIILVDRTCTLCIAVDILYLH